MLFSDKYRNVFYLVAVGLFVRLLIFFVFYTHVTVFPDSSGYIELAERLTAFDLSGYFGGRSPGYPLLLALTFGNLYVTVFVQFLLGIWASVFWYKTFLKLNFSAKYSLFFSLFLSTLLNVVFFETTILVESLTLFFFSVVVYQLVSGYFEKTALKGELIMGLLLGFLTLIKPFYAFVPFLFYGIYVFRKRQFKVLFSKKLIVIVFPLLVYFGWSYVNMVNTGYFVSSTYFGLNKAQNCVRFAEKGPADFQWIIDPYVKYRDIAAIEKDGIAMSIWDANASGELNKQDLSFPDLSNELGKFADATIKENPVPYLKQVIFYSWLDFWRMAIYWDYEAFNYKYVNIGFLWVWTLQKYLLILFRLAFLCIFPFILFLGFRKWKFDTVFVLSSLVFSTSVLQALVTYGNNSRFSFPFEFMMVMVVLLFLKQNKQYLNKFWPKNNL